jgi:hypothetical protein
MPERKDTDVESLKLYFEFMPRAGFNPDEALTWAYSFRDADVEKLKGLAQHLESQGYRVVSFFESDELYEGVRTGEYILSVEKVEKHTPETLAERNIEFARLASIYGFSVGNGENQ